MVDYCTSIAEVMGLNPILACIFSAFLFATTYKLHITTMVIHLNSMICNGMFISPQKCFNSNSYSQQIWSKIHRGPCTQRVLQLFAILRFYIDFGDFATNSLHTFITFS